MSNFIVNALMQKFGNQQGINNAINQFGSNLNQQGVTDPESYGRNLVNSGQMNQQTFNAYAAIADMLTGRRK